MSEYTEDKLVQETTADYLENNLGWNNIYAYDKEDYGPDSVLVHRELDKLPFRLSEYSCLRQGVF